MLSFFYWFKFIYYKNNLKDLLDENKIYKKWWNLHEMV